MIKKYIPRIYKNSKYMNSLYGTINQLFVDIEHLKENYKNQFFIETAVLGLAILEKEMELPGNGELTQRREEVLARIRGRGTCTTSLIKEVAKVYTGGNVEIIENFKGYSFIIKFINIVGTAPNIDGLRAIIEEIKPAHLSFDFEFKYNTWGDIKGKTWGALRGKTWGEIRDKEVEKVGEYTKL